MGSRELCYTSSGVIIAVGQTQVNSVTKPDGVILALDEDLNFKSGSASTSAWKQGDSNHWLKVTTVKCDPNSDEFLIGFNLLWKFIPPPNPGYEIGVGLAVTI